MKYVMFVILSILTLALLKPVDKIGHIGVHIYTNLYSGADT